MGPVRHTHTDWAGRPRDTDGSSWQLDAEIGRRWAQSCHAHTLAAAGNWEIPHPRSRVRAAGAWFQHRPGALRSRGKYVSASRQACSATRGRARLELEEEQATSSSGEEKKADD
jgi:hypothetical protein